MPQATGMLTPQSPMPTKTSWVIVSSISWKRMNEIAKADKPPDRRLTLQDDRADLVGHRCKRHSRCDNRCSRVNRTCFVWLVWHFNN